VNHIAGTHFDRLTVGGLYPAGARHDIEHLTLGVAVPVGACLGLEEDTEGIQRAIIGLRQRPEPHSTREILLGGFCPHDSLCRFVLHGLLTELAYHPSYALYQPPAQIEHGEDDHQLEAERGLEVLLIPGWWLAHRFDRVTK
jgi:hypothetical protein